MQRLARSFLRNQTGNVAIMTSLFMIVIAGFAALGVDLGKVFTDRRKAQSTVDLAALAAANDLPNATKAASATIQRNNYPAGTALTVEFGAYTADPVLKSSDRFRPAPAANANAVRVSMQTSSSLLFGRVLTGRDTFDVTTRATATQSAFASFAIGSRLLRVDGGMLNAMLGGLLGSNVNLSVMDYNALISARVDLFDFMNSLATRLDVTGVTYDSLLKMDVKAGDVLNALVDTEKAAYGPAHGAVKALSDIARATKGSPSKLRMNSLVDVGPYSTMPLGQKPKLSVAVAALDFLTATGQLANGQHQIEVGLNVNVPGLAGASLKLAVGERPKGTSWVTVGAAGASVHTAQTRLLLSVRAIGSGAAPIVNVPVYLELASATAKLTAVRCGFPDNDTSTATLGVTPALVDAWIGNVSNADFNNFKTAAKPGPAQIVNTSVLDVSGRAHVAITNMSATPVTFNMRDIAAETKKTVGTKNFSASLLSKLVGDLQLNVNVAGVGISLPGGATRLVADILADAVSPIDLLLSSVLQTLGVGLGQADTWVTGLRCDGAVLVN